MIALSDVRRLLDMETDQSAVLSLYLDTSVNSDNKRTWSVFLAKQRSRFAELASDNGGREPVGQVLSAIDKWMADEFRPENRGVAIFAALDGSFFEALQFNAPVRNQLELGDHPIVGQLREIVEANRRQTLLLVDRRKLRLVTVSMNVVEEDRSIVKEEYPASHDVKAGGEAAKDHQDHKAEEARQFFREFATEVQNHDRTWKPVAYVLLGTTENTSHFREFLPQPIVERIHHVAHASLDESPTALMTRLADYFESQSMRARAESIDALRERMKTGHYAAAGVDDTLEQLQEGKVETLVITRDLEGEGGQCTQCKFVLARTSGPCPYCGGSLRNGIDLAESMIRIATQQEAGVAFVEGDVLRELDGVGVLLRY